MFCILGMILLCGQPAGSHIPGKLAYAPSSSGYSAWTYAAYYSVPILDTQRLAIPAYANPFPPTVIPSIDQPGVIAPTVGRSYDHY
jgi:hypothetical protein